MKKRNIRIIIGILIAIFLILFMYIKLNLLFKPSESGYKATFMENADDIDVLLLGTSHMINAVFPMELWNEYGITSYNMAGHANKMPNSYWIMMNALDYSNPKLIILDCSNLSKDEKTADNTFHWSMDIFKLSKNKINAVNDLFTDPAKKMEYLFDFSLYHSRWNDITEDSFSEKRNVQYGGEMRIAVGIPDEMADINDVEKHEIDTYGTEYLRKIIEECQNRGIDILLAYLPFPADEETANESLIVEDIANEYGVDYLNFLKMDIVDFTTDCYDANSHLNPSGAGKVTSYLGNYIQSKYGIADNRGNEAYRDWDESYELYTKYKTEILKGYFDLPAYLMLLRNPDISVCLYLPGGVSVLDDERVYNLIDNIPIYQDLEKLSQAAEEKKDYFLMIDNGNVWEHIQDGNALDTEQSFGTVHYLNDQEGKMLSIQNPAGDYFYEADGEMLDTGIQILVFDKKTNVLVDAATYVDNGSYRLTRGESE